MRRRWLFLGCACIALLFPCAGAIFQDTALRCKLFGIEYKDCLNSIYRATPAHDAFLNSFGLPVRKSAICAYLPCRIALLMSGAEKVLSVAQSQPPSAECICLGVTDCGCDISEPQVQQEHIKIIYQKEEPKDSRPEKPDAEKEQIKTATTTKVETRTQTSTKTVQVTHTVTKELKTESQAPASTVHSVITIRTTKTYTATISQPLSPTAPPVISIEPTISRPVSHHQNRDRHNHKGADFPGSYSSKKVHVLTIPDSTVTVTQTRTLPVYSTLTRTKYLVNTVDNYITETVSKTKTQTLTMNKTRTETKTVTETVSDHIERTRVSTTYLPKTTTVSVTVTATATTVQSPSTSTKPAKTGPSPSHHLEQEKDQEEDEAPEKKKKHRQKRRHEKPRKQKLNGYIVIKKPKSPKILCISPNGCPDAGKVLSGECPITPGARSNYSCLPGNFSGRKSQVVPQIQIRAEKEEGTCLADCDVVKTVYVRAHPTPSQQNK